MREKNSGLGSINLINVLTIFYFWILIASPQNRFVFLQAIRFERVFVIFFWVALMVSGRSRIKVGRITFLYILFYLWLIISLLGSPYYSEVAPQFWLGNYWKIIVFYFMIIVSVNSRHDLFTLFAGFAIVTFLYQAHSWMDFLRGGSYVYQQGLKRMIGVWSSGVGAANAYGMLALFSLPFIHFWHRTTDNQKIRKFLNGYSILSVSSIIFSGTRGALIALGFYILLSMSVTKKSIGIFLVLAVICAIAFPFLPESLKYRYFQVESEDYPISDRMVEIQSESAQSRLTGLRDGWELAMRRPIFGYGPDTSATARLEVNPGLLQHTESPLGLHNLYGQLISEAGFCGALMFIGILLGCLSKIKVRFDMDPSLAPFSLVLRNYMFLMLFYGLAGHTLYRFYWVFLFASCEALGFLIAQERSFCER